ncbi:hypothetical protein AALM74_04650 [Parabacteroides segnis]|uniref:hypothetical protein n=1 Tax=Parabacteroides segnis TaxID=2763058 RepID=UPI0035169F36
MKKKLLEALKTKFVGIDEAILDRIATKKAEGLTDESKITALVDGITIQYVIQSYGDYRANEANVSSVNNYEEKYGLKDGKPVEKGGDGNGSGTGKEGKKTYTADELDSYLNTKLEEKWKPYQQEIETYKAEKAKSERQILITSKAKELGLTDSDMEFVTVPEGKDVSEFLTGYKQSLINRGLKPAESEGAQVGDEQVQNAVADDWLGSLTVSQ